MRYLPRHERGRLALELVRDHARAVALAFVLGAVAGVVVSCAGNPLAHTLCCTLLPAPGTRDPDAGPDPR